MLEWWNWKTHDVESVGAAGSTPASSTMPS